MKIYVTGRSCRLPGASNVSALHDVLFAKRDTVTTVPQDRWLHDYFLHPVPGTKGKTYTLAAGIVPDLWAFDATAFGISPREAGQMDPQQRMLLHVVWEALEDAGIPPDSLAGRQVGVFVGCSAMAHASRLAQDAALTDSYLMTGNTLALVSNRISHVLDLRGPSATIDTACSSSIFALKLAEDALRAGEVDIAIVAAANAILDPIHYVGFSAARMLSPTGSCKPFSANADGYVRAEGAAAIVLERASLRSIHPRRAYAELVAVGTNTDGRTLNVALPSVEGQSALLRKLYDDAGVNPEDLAFVEAHGTGTLAGDPVEATALGQVLGRARSNPLVIGSIKSNIGHLEPASGMAGLLKALIALEHRCYPASLHADTTNPHIDFQGLNLAVAQDHVPLGTSDSPLLAGVSSFGFGGANAHAILRSVPDNAATTPKAAPAGGSVLFLSAFGTESLRQSMQDYATLIDHDAQTGTQGLGDLAAQAAHFRGRHPHRAAVLCTTPDDTKAALEAAAKGTSDPRVLLATSDLTDAPAAFVFSGNGSQYAGMGLAAMAADPTYARGLKKIDRAFRKLSGWSIITKMHSPDLDTDLRDCAVAQPLLFADQMALVWALAERGLTPAAVMGHSGGEVAAACASGALSLDQALLLIHRRSLALQGLRGRGTMAAMQAAAEDVEAAILAFGGGIDIAAVNSPKSVTLVGPANTLDAFMRHARRAHRWPSVLLAIDYPYHGPPVDEVTTALAKDLAALVPGPTSLPFVSSVTGLITEGHDLNAAYWCANVRRPVAFLSAMQTLHDMGLRAFVEIGPAPVLGSYMSACLSDDAKAVVLTSFDKQDSAATNPVQRSLARAMAHGLKIDLKRLLPAPGRLRRDLPHYPWHSTNLRIDRTPGVLNRFGDDTTAHPLLGREEGVGVGIWYSEIDQHVSKVFCDHSVGGKVVMPGTALAEMALAAARATMATDQLELRDVDLLAPIVLGRNSLTEMRTRAVAEQAVIRIGARPRGSDAALRPHLQARFYPTVLAAMPDPAPDTRLLPGDKNADRLYASARRIGLDYGPNFALANRIRTISDSMVEVFLDPSPPVGRADSRTLLDVIGADAAFHGLIAAMETSDGIAAGMGYVPIRIGRLSLIKPYARVASARIEVLSTGKRSVVARFALYDAMGDGIALLEGVRFHALRLQRDISLANHSFRQIALPLDPADAAVPSLTVHAVTAIAEAPAYHPEDEGFFLLEAAAQAIAVEALRSMADASGLIKPMPGWPTPYAAALLAICERADTVTALPTGWQLTATATATDPEPLLAHLASAHPGRGAERALLVHLRAILPGLMAATDDLPTPQTLFGREALANLTDGSVFAARSTAVLAAAAQGFAQSWPQNRALRIAEVTDGAAQILPVLLRQLPAARASLHEIIVTPVDEPAAPVSLPLDRVTQIEAKADALAAAGPFDLIVMHGLLHRMAAPAGLLRLLASSLSDMGQLALTEPVPSDFADLVFGTDSGWFADITAPTGPTARLFGPDDLATLASQAGLPTAQTASLPEGCGTASLLLAKPLATAKPVIPSDTALIGHLHRLLTTPTTGGTPLSRIDTQDRTLIHLAPAPDQDDPVKSLSARFLALRDLLAELSTTQRRLVVLLPGGTGQVGPAHPGQTALWSLMRTAANENQLLPMACYDIAPDVTAEQAARRIAALETSASPETEVILHANGTTALRVMHGTGDAAPSGQSDSRSLLDAPVTGGLDDLRWKLLPRRTPAEGEVEIAITATGLNYRDVMWSMGLLPEEALEKGFAGPTIGIECAGTVTRVGPGVTHLAPGDNVLTFGPALFASHQVVRADLAARLPDGLTPEAATTIPVAFFTAWYSLVTLAGLRRGEWVLIHGGAGGVGLAAIQIAQRAGAHVIATAGSGVKRALLRAEGVAHVLDSRSLTFADQVRSITSGRGVDVVLNALAGDAMERSLGCLAPFGRFLELGKQDFYSNTAVGLRALKENISYHGIDVDQLMAARPALATEIYADMMQAFHAGDLRPLPYRAFDGTDAVAAFRLMQKSGHIGKVVIRPADPAQLPATSAPFTADPTGTHIVVGGLGGLGVEVADWLIQDAGARHVVLMGRKAAASDDLLIRLRRWKDHGAHVRLVACDVADAAALEQTLATLRAERRIAGIIHSAMVLDDMPMSRVDAAVLARTLPAKVAGGANLDRLTRGDDLDYFVLFSSLATLIGNHGQSSYVAANGYLEGIVRRRRQQGLPALAIGWGGIADVGYLSRDKDKAVLVRRMSGNVDFSGLQAMRALDRILAMGNAADPVIHVSPMGWNAVAVTLRTLTSPSFQLLRTLGRRTESETGDEDLRDLLLGLPFEKARDRLVAWLVGRVAHILQVSEQAVNVAKPVSELGIDSLMGVELGLTLQDSLGDDVPATSVSDALSIRDIADRIVRHIQGDTAPEGIDGDDARLALQHLSVASDNAPPRAEAAE